MSFEHNEIIEKKDFYCRTCSECGKGMNEGFLVGGGMEYYCTDECLHKHYTKEEWENEMYSDDSDENYWTEWDIDEEYEQYLEDNNFELKQNYITNNQDIRMIEKHIYNRDYDDLSDYGKGIRDLLNYLNKSEEIEQKDLIYCELKARNK